MTLPPGIAATPRREQEIGGLRRARPGGRRSCYGIRRGRLKPRFGGENARLELAARRGVKGAGRSRATDSKVEVSRADPLCGFNIPWIERGHEVGVDQKRRDELWLDWTRRREVPEHIATTPTLCVATGGHPSLAALRQAFAVEVPATARVGRLLASAVGLPWVPR